MCNCTTGWSGLSCEIPSCSDLNNCTDQGTCVSYNLCECFDGYDGDECEELTLPNEAAPVFLQPDYNVTIPEHTASGSVILTVQANDTDIGRNGQVSYSLAFGTEFFAISSESGEISTRVVFDYESTLLPNEFDLVVIAEDNGRPSLTSSASVTVFISDLNDNCPELYEGDSVTYVTLSPDAPVGTTVHQIFAEDSDSDSNGEVLYTLFQASESITSMFTVSENGTISTIATLQLGSYDIRVSVSDQGDPPCSIIIQVYVDVEDVKTTPPPTTTTGRTNNLKAILKI